MRISDWSSDLCSSDLIFSYAKTSGAYMAGGFNLRQGSLPAFKPEGVKDIEFGIKADWFDKRLRTNIAVFHSWQSDVRSEEHTSDVQSLMRISYAVFCLKKKKHTNQRNSLQ